MIKVLFQLLLLYIGYKFIFGFIIPLFNSTRQMQSNIKNMQDRMQQQQRQQQQQQPQNSGEPKIKPRQEDYIEFEEIK
ncbi:MAG: hypothetical protein IPL97_02840 [Niastella sp.]|nr:hypothetical protein [Niastella sp.]